MAEKIRLISELRLEKFNEEDITTQTSEEQIGVEKSAGKLYELLKSVSEIEPDAPKLLRKKHVSFLKQSLTNIGKNYQCLDASRPWFCYWILHSLDLLGEKLADEDKAHIAQFLKRCQCSDGGFGGGPGQYPHLAPTYAAVNSLCILGTQEAYNIIDREGLVKFLWSIKSPNGAFEIHKDGEIDIRGVYCAASVARLTNIYSEELFENSADWIISCQTYEGGFSGCPGMEAHGGYAFCGLAALALLGKDHLCDMKAFLRWAVNRQMRFEGGFQGRTNKLVDGCYSFWQGGAFPLVHRAVAMTDLSSLLDDDRWLFHQEALQEYVLVCCQSPTGGLIDKPNKQTDIYHTCYALSGLSVAQHCGRNRVIVGARENELATVHPLYNIGSTAAMAASKYFQKLPIPCQNPPATFQKH